MDNMASTVAKANKTIQKLTTDQDLQSVLATLKLWHINSGPVLDAKTDEVVGFFDVVDALSFLVKELQSAGPTDNLDPGDVKRLEAKAKEFMVSDIQHSGAMHSNLSLPQDASVRDAAKLLADTHRIALTGADGKVCNIMTQCDLIKWMADENFSSQPREALDQKIGDLGTNKVISVSTTSTTWEAFVALRDTGKVAVALTDSDGLLHGVLSASDVKYITSSYQDLLEPISDYVANVRREQDRQPGFILTVTKDNTVEDALKLMAKERVHRIFVVAESDPKVALSCLTTTDLLRKIFSPSTV